MRELWSAGRSRSAAANAVHCAAQMMREHKRQMRVSPHRSTTWATTLLPGSEQKVSSHWIFTQRPQLKPLLKALDPTPMYAPCSVDDKK